MIIGLRINFLFFDDVDFCGIFEVFMDGIVFLVLINFFFKVFVECKWLIINKSLNKLKKIVIIIGLIFFFIIDIVI